MTPNPPITQENAALLKAGAINWPELKALGYRVEKTARFGTWASQWDAYLQTVGKLSSHDTKGAAMRACRNHADRRPALAKPAEGGVDSSHGSVYDRLLTFIHDRDDALRGDDRTDPNEIDETVLAIMRIATPTPPSVDWERVGPKLVEALETIKAGGSWQGDTAFDALAAATPGGK